MLADQDDLHKQNEDNMQQQNIYEIPLMESEETVISDMESNLFESANNEETDIVRSVARKQIIKRTTGKNACPLYYLNIYKLSVTFFVHYGFLNY